MCKGICETKWSFIPWPSSLMLKSMVRNQWTYAHYKLHYGYVFSMLTNGYNNNSVDFACTIYSRLIIFSMIGFVSVFNRSILVARRMIIVEHDVYWATKSRMQVVNMSTSVRVAVALHKFDDCCKHSGTGHMVHSSDLLTGCCWRFIGENTVSLPIRGASST